MLKRLKQGRIGPWLCVGDFNEVSHEKMGQHEKIQKQMQLFKETLADIDMKDLGFLGPAYTWSNGRKGKDCVWAT